MRNAGGYLIVTDPNTPMPIERDTFTCCHCNGVVIVKPGSGIERGFCFMEMKPHCGKKECWGCVPFEQRLEAMEGKYRFQKMMERL